MKKKLIISLAEPNQTIIVLIKILLGVVLSLLWISTSAQTQTTYSSINSDTLPDKFKIDANQLRDHIYAGIPAKYKTARRERGLFHFSDQNAYRISQLVSSGRVYSDWPSLENYLNQILLKVMPDEIKNDSVVHAYVAKNPSFNAYMTPTGMTFIHIGLLTYVEDEATIAAILAHELAHYYKKHSLMGYVKNKSKDFSVGRKSKRISEFSIANEVQCDSLALLWLKQAGYNLEGSLKGFTIMKQLEQKRIDLSNTKFELKAVSHPLPDERKANFESFIANNESQGADFLISKNDFIAFKKEAQKETLKYLLEGFNYTQCMEMAFKFHVMDFTNPIYVQYLLESIRRLCYLDASLWKKKFITSIYFKTFETENNRFKKEWPDHLFVGFQSHILGISEAEKEKITANFYWDMELPRFITYEEAFVFYYAIAQKMGDHEAILSNALSITLDINLRNTYLREYLSHDDIQYRSYAQHLLDGDIISMLPKKKLFVIADQLVYLKQGKERIPIRSKDETDKRILKSMIDSALLDFPNRKSVYLDELSHYNLNQYSVLEGLNNFSITPILSQGQKLELHVLDPRYWDAFRRYGVNEIEFLNYYFVETRKSEKTISAYSDILAIDYKDLFSHQKRIRDLSTLTSSVRLINNRLMKVRNFDIDEFRFRVPTRPQFIQLMEENINEWDTFVEKEDNRYQYDFELEDE